MGLIQYGVTFPAGAQAHHELGHYTRRVEALGLDSIWLIENVGSATPGLECLSTLGFMAACSTRLKIGTSVLLLPLRNPVLTAQAVSTLDVLSGGRVILGVGAGDPSSHTAVGADPHTRGRRCEEALTLLRMLWTESDVTYEGAFYRVQRHTLGPRPIQSPHPPIWLGGHTDAAFRRAARHADGFIPVGAAPEQCRAVFEKVERHARELGRDPPTRAVHAYLCLAESGSKAAEMGAQTLTHRYQRRANIDDREPHFIGTPGDIRRTLEAFLETGVTHFVFDPVCPLEQVPAQLTRLATEVLGLRSGGER